MESIKTEIHIDTFANENYEAITYIDGVEQKITGFRVKGNKKEVEQLIEKVYLLYRAITISGTAKEEFTGFLSSLVNQSI